MNPKKSSAKKTHSKKKTSKKSSVKKKQNLPIPPAPKKASYNSEKKERIYSNVNFEKKAEITARNLLRLYQFLQMDKPLNETTLIHEIELDTPNEKLREQIMQLKLEIESLHEENRALQQTALRTQVEAEEQVEAVQVQNRALKTKIKEMEQLIKEELQKRASEYEKIIDGLRNRLKQAILQTEKYTEIDEGIRHLQEQVTSLFDQNEQLQKEKTGLKNQLEDSDHQIEELQEKITSLEKKNKELEKKTELQKMVIEGYKRKEKDIFHS
ncbi:MAG: hypothetical protein ACTSUK_00970 [Promethearchaeota archaeon]